MGTDLPQAFGNYTLHQLIARGGMAEIYRATMPGIGGFEKTVAIKKILPHLAENEEFITMLKDEANILVSISHSNVAQVYDLGKIEETYYISMEYVHGIDLAGIIKAFKKRDEHVPIPHAVYIGAGMCAGLHAAHTNTDKQGNPLNIVHRDVSPHNVIISYAGDVKLIDFGVAKAAVKETHTQMGVIKGKLLYMAPEQAMAKDLDGRADLFAVGLCMYKMLTHELPFRGDNEFQIYNNILSKEIVPPRQLNPAVPEEVNQIVMTLLQRDPDKRYQDGYAAKQDLERALHNTAPGYTVNRLSRFIEENFSEAQKSQQSQSAEDISGPAGVAPQTPSANSVGTGQLTGGDDIPELDAEVQSLDDQSRERVPAPGSGPGFGAESADSGFRTQTSSEKSTGSLNADKLAAGGQLDTKKSLPAAVYAIGALVLVIVGLVAYGALQPPDDEAPSTQPVPTAQPGADPSVAAAAADLSPTITLALDSEPSGAGLFRGGERLATTPAELLLKRSDEPLELTLRLEGYEPETFQVVPDSDIEHTMTLAADEDDGEGSTMEFGDPEEDDGAAEEQGLAPQDDAAAPGGSATAEAPKPQPKPQPKPAAKPAPAPKPAPPPTKPEVEKQEQKTSAKSGGGQAPPPASKSTDLFGDSDDSSSEPAAEPEKKEEKPKKKEEIIDPFG